MTIVLVIGIDHVLVVDTGGHQHLGRERRERRQHLAIRRSIGRVEGALAHAVAPGDGHQTFGEAASTCRVRPFGIEQRQKRSASADARQQRAPREAQLALGGLDQSHFVTSPAAKLR